MHQGKEAFSTEARGKGRGIFFFLLHEKYTINCLEYQLWNKKDSSTGQPYNLFPCVLVLTDVLIFTQAYGVNIGKQTKWLHKQCFDDRTSLMILPTYLSDSKEKNKRKIRHLSS